MNAMRTDEQVSKERLSDYLNELALNPRAVADSPAGPAECAGCFSTHSRRTECPAVRRRGACLPRCQRQPRREPDGSCLCCRGRRLGRL